MAQRWSQTSYILDDSLRSIYDRTPIGIYSGRQLQTPVPCTEHSDGDTLVLYYYGTLYNLVSLGDTQWDGVPKPSATFLKGGGRDEQGPSVYIYRTDMMCGLA